MGLQMNFQLSEIFYTIQGEAFYGGYPAVFIRLAACNLKCSWCDTDFRYRETITLEELLERAEETMPTKRKGVIFVISGGEPTLQNYPALVIGLNERFPGHQVTMESNGRDAHSSGMRELREMGYLFLTCSPKIAVEDCSKYFINPDWEGDEIKIVLDPAFTTLQLEMLGNLPETLGSRFKHYYIQPCSQDFAPTVKFIKENPKWRLSLQTQKILSIR